MKNCILLLFILNCFYYTKAQVNLIPNSSFDDTLNISTIGDPRAQRAITDWHNLDSTRIQNCLVMYLHFNSVNFNFKLPYNSYLYQYPRNGYGFINLTTYYTPLFTPQPTTLRSVARCKLKTKLATVCPAIPASYKRDDTVPTNIECEELSLTTLSV